MTVAYKNIARVVRPHGKNGEVVAHPVDGLPFLIERGMRVALTPPALGRDRFQEVLDVAPAPEGGRLLLSGIEDLNAAQACAGCFVLARVDELDLGPLDAAYSDLVGREVEDERFGSLGTIEEIMQTPANDVWVIAGGPYGEVLLPVIEQCVTGIPAEGAIGVHVLDGLIDIAD